MGGRGPLVNRSCTRDSIGLNYNINRGNESNSQPILPPLFAPLETRFKFRRVFIRRSLSLSPSPQVFVRCIQFVAFFRRFQVSARDVKKRKSFFFLSYSPRVIASHFYFISIFFFLRVLWKIVLNFASKREKLR